MMGNPRMSCTFTMQQIGSWVVTHSKADSNLHGHCFAISRKLWILYMSQHLNPPFAFSDHCESVAWLISNDPHSALYCYQLGPNGVKVECLCPQKPTTIFQHTHATADCAWPRPPITKDMKTLVTLVTHKCRVISSLPPWLGFIVSALHAVRTQCTNLANVLRFMAMTICLCHGGICELNIGCSWPQPLSGPSIGGPPWVCH